MGTLSAIPVFALAAKSNKEEFLKILELISPDENKKKITKKRTCCPGVIPELLKILGGVSSAIGVSYLDYTYYYPSLKFGCLIFIIPSFITNVTVGYWGLDKGAKLLSNLIKKCFKRNNYYNSKVINIREKLESARLIVKKMTSTAVDELINKPFEQMMKDVFFVKEDEEEKEEEKVPLIQQTKPSLGKVLFQGVGALIATVGSWATQPFTVEATKSFLKGVGLQNSIAVELISQVAGYYAWFTAASLLNVSSYNVYENIYDSISNKNCKNLSISQCGINILWFMISGISATHRVELSLKYTNSVIAKPIVAVCSAIGRVALNYFSIKGFFNCSITPLTKKEKLINFIDEILNIIDSMNSDSINKLEKILNIKQKKQYGSTDQRNFSIN